jgi:hypothetical protein
MVVYAEVGKGLLSGKNPIGITVFEVQKALLFRSMDPPTLMQKILPSFVLLKC